jgi:hypothetical protein
MKAQLMLCDFAQVAEGKLNILGGGISLARRGVPQVSLAGLVDVPWNLANTEISATFTLLDADGHHVTDPMGVDVTLQLGFEMGRPPGTVKGAPLTWPFAVTIATHWLPPGRYTWRLDLNGETHEDWTTTLSIVET